MAVKLELYYRAALDFCTDLEGFSNGVVEPRQFTSKLSAFVQLTETTYATTKAEVGRLPMLEQMLWVGMSMNGRLVAGAILAVCETFGTQQTKLDDLLRKHGLLPRAIHAFRASVRALGLYKGWLKAVNDDNTASDDEWFQV